MSGQAWFRVKLRPDPSNPAKTVPWLQSRLWGFLWWRWHCPITNRYRSLQKEAIELHRKLQATVDAAEEAGQDVDRAIKETTFDTREGVGGAFQAPWFPREEPLPDSEEEFTRILKLIRLGTEGKRARRGGTSTAFIPDVKPLNGEHMMDAFKRTGEGDNYDHVIQHRRQQQQQKQNSRRRNKQGNKGHEGGRSVTINLDDTDES